MSEQDIEMCDGWNQPGTVAYERYRADVNDAKIIRLRSLLKEAVAALETAETALNNYADVVDGDEGQPRANAAMQAQLEVQATLSKIKGAA